MIDLTRDQFIAFCLKQGPKKYDPTDVWNCAFSQFFRSEVPEIRSTTVDFDDGLVEGIDPQWARIAELQLEGSEVEIVMQMGQTFADIASQFEGGEAR